MKYGSIMHLVKQFINSRRGTLHFPVPFFSTLQWFPHTQTPPPLPLVAVSLEPQALHTPNLFQAASLLVVQTHQQIHLLGKF